MRSTEAVLFLRHGKLFDHFLSIRIHETRLREFKSVSRGRGGGGRGSLVNSSQPWFREVSRIFEILSHRCSMIYRLTQKPKIASRLPMDFKKYEKKLCWCHNVDLSCCFRVALLCFFFYKKNVLPCPRDHGWGVGDSSFHDFLWFIGISHL